MAEVNRFEDLVAWQKARVLTGGVYRASRKPGFARDFGLSSQVQRASVSTMSNIAEGFERGKRKEFHQALSTAKGSCAEVRSLLYIASDVGYLSETEFKTLMAQAEEVSRIVGGLRSAVERQIEREEAGRRTRSRTSTQSSALSPQS
jgi:four helix bundle protein